MLAKEALGIDLFKGLDTFMTGVFNRIFHSTVSSQFNIADFSKAARVEPICLIDSSVLYHDGLSDILQSLTNMFAGYYLQAVALSAQVNDVSVIKHLEKFNPNSNAIFVDPALESMTPSLEAYAYGLPGFDGNDDKQLAHDRDLSSNTNKSTVANINNITKELANLSVGRLINVTISVNGQNVTVPVSIRLQANRIASSNLIDILSLGSLPKSIKDRYHAWRSGRLEFIRDIIFCQDIINAHRKAAVKDTSGAFNEILRREKNITLKTLLDGEARMGGGSNILICSKDTIDELEGKIGKRLSDNKFRATLFSQSYLMIIAVLDKEWERVTFYHNGVNEVNDLSLKDIKTASKGNGPNISDILKAYLNGSAPNL